ncbi:iq calmodulin-binding domain-containing protein [Diaporthe amygdali]|uniref:iq calmodulin-binding domain-containing protein n=1 Tax=Phomopsis amygdali TaxID=1214568 RepID=UPI0022FE72A2|nr:iq calmodulin-binding domain-containing protein [Diaporthe amygdali]KAJ0108935.1 iq calmodulin-binding domain-containing protein [Diaporthe amygdali]
MTATSTRSTRRAETLVALPPLAHAHRSPATAAATRLHQQNSSRPLKRLHDATNLRYDLKSPKKPKITVEIPSKSQYQARLFPENVDARQHHRPSSTHKPPKQDHRHPASAPLPPPPATAHTAAPPPAPAPATGDAATTTGQDSSAAPTKHREKVVNGIKHELDRLQPSSADMAASNGQGRKLRSQEGVRFKSELSAYFPEYDEVIGNVPKEEHILMLDTPIIVVDTSPSSASTSAPRHEPHSTPSTFPIRNYGDDLFTNLHDSQAIDLSWLEGQYKGKTLSDPLPDSYYESIHRKESRNEKITRNAERGRSQHEKAQVIRLLDGLKGPDWLKTMGVSGITESKKKQFEPARAHFVHKCEVVLDKFAKWAAEEKRLKLEKERAAKESLASQDTDSSKAEDDEEEDEEAISSADELGDDEEGGEETDKSDSEPPDMSDVDASAKQLHEEAMARSRLAAKSAGRRPLSAQPLPPPPPAEFTSFFKKPYQRDAALNKSRRRGRTVLAWGQALPELEEQDFVLPEEYRDEEMLKARERRLRILRRGSRHRG